MDAKEIVEKIFEENGIEWNVKNFDKFVDPKCKTASSIYDKLLRLYSQSGEKGNYTILDSNIDDLLRMTVIVDYKDVVKTINKLKSKFSDLSGYLQIEDAGYRGVHLNLKIDGLPCEIQLAPMVVVMAVDYLHTLYEKWRSFNAEAELKALNINNNFNKIELEKEKVKLQDKLQDEKKDFALRNKIYGEIYKIAEFDKYRDEINLVLKTLNEKKKESSSLKDINLIQILNQNLLKDGFLDREKIRNVAMLLSNNLQPIQKKFVKLVKSCLN